MGGGGEGAAPEEEEGEGSTKIPGLPAGGLPPGTMCAERLGQFVTLALVLATFDPARGTDATHPPEGPQDRGSQQKGRLSLQNTGKDARPRGGGLLGGPARHPRSAPGVLRPARGAHLGPCRTLGAARDVQSGA